MQSAFEGQLQVPASLPGFNEYGEIIDPAETAAFYLQPQLVNQRPALRGILGSINGLLVQLYNLLPADPMDNTGSLASTHPLGFDNYAKLKKPSEARQKALVWLSSSKPFPINCGSIGEESRAANLIDII